MTLFCNPKKEKRTVHQNSLVLIHFRPINGVIWYIKNQILLNYNFIKSKLCLLQRQYWILLLLFSGSRAKFCKIESWSNSFILVAYSLCSLGEPKSIYPSSITAVAQPQPLSTFVVPFHPRDRQSLGKRRKNTNCRSIYMGLNCWIGHRSNIIDTQ
jgi:hypothetical protein